MPDTQQQQQQQQQHEAVPPQLHSRRESVGGAPAAAPSPAALRNYILATDRHACVHREVRPGAGRQQAAHLDRSTGLTIALAARDGHRLQLWNDGRCTYLDLRSYIM